MGPLNAIAVWNRATCGESAERLARGDKALRGMLCAHGLIMNGGVFHALDVLDEEQVKDAVEGYGFFGLASVSDLLAKATELLRSADDVDAQESLLDSEYEHIVPDDSFLFSVFERHYNARPSDFAG